MQRKYVFVSGGVVSSLGKGISAAFLGRLLKSRGYKISMQKLDPYYNVDPGLLSPLQHGETFVTEDGTCADLDLGHYERIVDCNLSGKSSVTTGKIHKAIMERELRGEYKGATVQVIPHVTNEIISQIKAASDIANSEIAIIEIGGTVGDMESAPYFEAARQMKRNLPKDSCCFVHVTLLPMIEAAGEIKTKPTQHSVKVMREIGIQPDIIVCRSHVDIPSSAKDKIALFCNVKKDRVIENLDAKSLSDVAILLENEGFADKVCEVLNLEIRKPDLSDWYKFINDKEMSTKKIHIAIVGKYVELKDAYLSCVEALYHAGYANHIQVEIHWIDSEYIDNTNYIDMLKQYDGILAPGGYGAKGTEGIILSSKYSRENKIPFMAIGLGMQLAFAEIVRSLLNKADANTLEANSNTKNPIASIPDDRKCQNDSRGAARLGSHYIRLTHKNLISVYGKDQIAERHSNRYEITKQYNAELEKFGVKMAGISSDNKYPEIYTIEDHPFYIITIYHSEYKSRPNKPHPLFNSFIQTVANNTKH